MRCGGMEGAALLFGRVILPALWHCGHDSPMPIALVPPGHAAFGWMQVKERVLQNRWSFALQAKKYSHWMEAQVGRARESCAVLRCPALRFNCTPSRREARHCSSAADAALLAPALARCLSFVPCPLRSLPDALLLQAAGKPEVVPNAYRSDPGLYRHPRLAWMLASGMVVCVCSVC